MKKYLAIVILSLSLACSTNVQEEGILGTWNFKASEAPFGLQSGRVIFYEENDSVKAEIKMYGFTIHTEDLVLTEDKLSFTAVVEHEEVSIQLTPDMGKYTGEVLFSEGSMPLVLQRKGKARDGGKALSTKACSKRRKTMSGEAIKEIMQGEEFKSDVVDYRVHTYYYGWYGNAENGDERAWNHSVIPHWIDTTWNNVEPYAGGDDVGSNFYPELANYSSKDPEVIDTHMQQIRDAGIGVVAISWWGKDNYTDHSVSMLLNSAQKYGLKLIFHMEPFYNTVEELTEQLDYMADSYLQHPAIFKIDGLPLYYLYNSFQLKHDEWSSILNEDSETSIRNTSKDGIFISLWTTQFDGEFAVKSCFDGIYTYFASDGFAYGSTTSNWPDMATFARDNDLIYIPCVGPGYIDTRIRPWNEKTTKNREGGKYYEEMYAAAVNTGADFIGITSFNEWHEGTQIEPAVPKSIPSFTYEDYGAETDPAFYIKKSRELIFSPDYEF